MVNENRIADIIAERLSTHLSTEVIKAQALTGTRLIIQGHVQGSNMSDQRVIDLVGPTSNRGLLRKLTCS